MGARESMGELQVAGSKCSANRALCYTLRITDYVEKPGLIP